MPEREEKNVKRCYVIGDPIAHSLSPLLHRSGYRALGLEREFDFSALQVSSADLPAFIKRVREDESICGVSCTLPHKSSVMEYLDSISDEAQATHTSF